MSASLGYLFFADVAVAACAAAAVAAAAVAVASDPNLLVQPRLQQPLFR